MVKRISIRILRVSHFAGRGFTIIGFNSSEIVNRVPEYNLPNPSGAPVGIVVNVHVTLPLCWRTIGQTMSACGPTNLGFGPRIVPTYEAGTNTTIHSDIVIILAIHRNAAFYV